MSAAAAVHPLFGTRLPNGWKLVSLDDVKSPEKSSCVAGPCGSNISSKYFTESGVPIIRGGNLRDDLTRFVPTGFAFVSKQQASQYKAQHVRAGDLVFTCWGTVGQVGLIPENGPFPEYIISNKQLKLRPNLEIADPLYLFFYLAGPKMVQHVLGRAIGAAVPGINLGILKQLPVVLPPLSAQRRISRILSAYDELIENCQQRIRILEAMARSLYREWFINFRFPGHEKVRRVTSALGEIPEGWEPKTVGDLTEYLNRGLSPTYSEDGPSIVINQKCIRDQRVAMRLARRQSKVIPTAKQVRFGDVLINSTGVGTLGRVAQVYKDIDNCTVDSHVTIARAKEDIDIDFFGYTLLNRQDAIERLGIGATGQTELSKSAIAGLEVAVPGLDIQRAFSRQAGPIRNMMVLLADQIDNLKRTRDLLLPRLLSGNIRIGVKDDHATNN
jgi:type I restriction enzyme, S subunit